MKKHLIEEAYEVCDAIDSRNPAKLKDELGDFLFQVIFHAQIARERGAFDIEDVLCASYEKMIRRHPHVFGKKKASGPDEAYRRWQEKKDLEKAYKEKKTLLKGIPNVLPALLKAQKVSKRAAGLGFEWPHIEAIIKKIEEELTEIKRAVNHKNKFSEEYGDMLFAAVTLARFKGIDAESALNNATKKFAKRFEKMEKGLKRQGKGIGDCSLRELGRLWNLHKIK